MLVDSPELIFDMVAHVGVFAHGRHAPDPNAWQQACARIRAAPSLRCGLIFSDGGSPTASQRAEIVDAFGESRFRTVRSAIVSTSVSARFVVTALSLFTPHLKIFAPRDARGAVDFVASIALRNEVLQLVRAMEKNAGVRFPAVRAAVSGL